MKLKKLILILLLLFLTACQGNHHGEDRFMINHATREANEHIAKSSISMGSTIIPITVDYQSYFLIIGWVSNQEVLINHVIDGKSKLLIYHVNSGASTELLTLNGPIISASISPSRELLLIHTSPMAYHADISIYRLDTYEKIFEKGIESSEITYEWNMYDETKILVTAFYEDWTYSTYLIHTNKKSLEEISIPQPFAVWKNEEQLLSINWNQDMPSLTAPLIQMNGIETSTILPDEQFYYLDSWKEGILLFKVLEEDETMAELQFLDNNFNHLFTIQSPHLPSYSGWQIPFYSFTNQYFYMIEVKDGYYYNPYSAEFQLVKRNLESGSELIIFDSIENKPLECSPNGKYCLYGYEFESIIITDEQKLVPFLAF